MRLWSLRLAHRGHYGQKYISSCSLAYLCFFHSSIVVILRFFSSSVFLLFSSSSLALRVSCSAPNPHEFLLTDVITSNKAVASICRMYKLSLYFFSSSLLPLPLLSASKEPFGRAPAGSGSGTVAGCRSLGGRQEAVGAGASGARISGSGCCDHVCEGGRREKKGFDEQ